MLIWNLIESSNIAKKNRTFDWYQWTFQWKTVYAFNMPMHFFFYICFDAVIFQKVVRHTILSWEFDGVSCVACPYAYWPHMHTHSDRNHKHFVPQQCACNNKTVDGAFYHIFLCIYNNERNKKKLFSGQYVLVNYLYLLIFEMRTVEKSTEKHT